MAKKSGESKGVTRKSVSNADKVAEIVKEAPKEKVKKQPKKISKVKKPTAMLGFGAMLKGINEKRKERMLNIKEKNNEKRKQKADSGPEETGAGKEAEN